MRASRVSQETSKLVDALSASRRVTRSSTTSSYFGSVRANRVKTRAEDKADIVKEESSDAENHKDEKRSAGDDESSCLSEANTTDIEDLLKPEPDFKPSLRKRKRESLSTAKNGVSESDTPSSGTRTRKPRKVIVKEEEVKEVKEEAELPVSFTKKKSTKGRKPPPAPGSIPPPPNWEEMYDIVKKMRLANPTAPVDTMGCAELYWRNSTEQERRFHILVALMLSSQTKDTVTAVAMQKLHTQLGPENDHDGESPTDNPTKWDITTHPTTRSTLTIANVLRVSAQRFNQLIHSVGFHNLKTKYIRTTASILRDQYDFDIPRTADALMQLPGVGPKMAFLCMSSAWGVDEGIGVDVHVHRIANLWGWVKTKAPEETRMALEAWLPKGKWREINWLLVGLGQTVCLPVGRRCGECALAGTGLCKAEIKGAGVKMRRKAKETVIKNEVVEEEVKMEVKVEEDV